MSEDHRNAERFVQLTDTQAGVLRKHLDRGTISLDDAAILLGVPVEDLAQNFQGRRAGPERPARDGERRRSRSHSYDPDERGVDDEVEMKLHAPERREPRARGRSWIWAGGALAGAVVVGALALLSGVPQSLLFPPRGVSAHKDPNAVTETAAGPAVEGVIAQTAPEAAAAEAPAAETAVDPLTAGATPDPAADPALADPNAPPPPDPAAAAAEAPVPAPPEEVAPAVAVAEADVPVEATPEAPSFTAPDAASAAPAALPGPSTTLYAARAAAVRDAPTATGSATQGQLKRGDTVSGSIVAGADGKSSWLHIESGPGVGGYVSVANMADAPRPAVVQALGQPRTLVQGAALHAAPDAGSATLDTLSPGISVLAAAEVEGGWIEINRRAGGVGYVRKEAFE